MARMTRFRNFAWLVLVAVLALYTLLATTSARANVTAIAITRRTCGTVDAFSTYDGFSEGKPAFYVAFAVDLNGNGVFGEAGEPIRYVKIAPTGQQEFVGAHLQFNPLPEGSTISVTSYEVDSAGVPVSRQVTPVAYECKHRPALDKLPANAPVPVPMVGVVAKVRIVAVTVFTAPTVRSTPLGGLGKGALVNVTAINQRGDWVQIDYLGRPGWIMWQTTLILFGPYATLPRLPNAENYTATPLPPTATPG